MSDLSDTILEEWKETRSVLGRFDGYLDELRKYGFSFLAGLFTVDAIGKYLLMEPKYNYVKFGLIVITITFIVTLRLLDQNYMQFQNAASIRARILERLLNIEITGTISNRYNRVKLHYWILGLYFVFVGIAALIGCIILPQEYWPLVIIAAIIGGLVILLLKYLAVDLLHPVNHYIQDFSKDYQQKLKKRIGSKENFDGELPPLPKEDWIIDRITCKIGENVRIIVTNLDNEYPIFIEGGSGQPVFIILEEGKDRDTPIADAVCVETVKDEGILIPKNGNYSWLWKTGEWRDGCKECKPNTVYRIWPRGWDAPLHRSIIINQPEIEIDNISVI